MTQHPNRSLVQRSLAALPASLVMLSLVSIFGVQSAAAIDFTVTKVGDTRDGVCNADCSLREAIIAANNLAGADVVIVPPGTYILRRAPVDEDAAFGGDLDVIGPLTITGAGARRTIIDASAIPGGERAIDVVGPGSSLEISRVTITGGSVSGEFGGGIRSEGPLTVIASTILDNSAGVGGGIHCDTTLNLVRSTVSGNQSIGDGAGVNVNGDAEIVNSTISGNTMTGGGNGSAISLGGSTTLTAENVTIAGNSSDAPERGALSGPNTADAFLKNTILSNAPTANCFFLTVETEGNNLSSDDSCDLDAEGDQTGTDPLLSPLQNNGGPTDTHTLRPGSPAIDAGSDPPFPPTDQRGVDRPRDGDLDSILNVDIGAVEIDDILAPTVVEVSPEEDATGAPPATVVVATFSERMAPDSINPDTVQLFKVGETEPVAAAISYNPAVQRAILNPDANLERNARYRAVVTNGARDLSGNQLDQEGVPGNQPKTWLFRVRR